MQGRVVPLHRGTRHRYFPMDQFVITGGLPLHGVIRPAGNKNAALPLLAACLLTDEPVVLHNVPAIGDVLTMRNLLEGLGVVFSSVGKNSWKTVSYTHLTLPTNREV